MIRRATRDDAAGIARIHVSVWRDAYADFIPADFLASLSERRRVSFWNQQLTENKHLTFVAFDGGEMVGWASGGPSRDADATGESEVYAICVARAHWRRGVGRGLMTALEDALPGGRAVGLWVLRLNMPAVRFYETLGYARVGGEKEINIGGATLTGIRLKKNRANPHEPAPTPAPSGIPAGPEPRRD